MNPEQLAAAAREIAGSFSSIGEGQPGAAGISNRVAAQNLRDEWQRIASAIEQAAHNESNARAMGWPFGVKSTSK